jgi:hypothetical protein
MVMAENRSYHLRGSTCPSSLGIFCLKDTVEKREGTASVHEIREPSFWSQFFPLFHLGQSRKVDDGEALQLKKCGRVNLMVTELREKEGVMIVPSK